MGSRMISGLADGTLSSWVSLPQPGINIIPIINNAAMVVFMGSPFYNIVSNTVCSFSLPFLAK